MQQAKRFATLKAAVSVSAQATKDADKSLAVGDRCVVGDKRWHGVVRFVGPTDFAEGTWIGIELDLKLGKNDGSVRGSRYFLCEANRGIFVRSNVVMQADANLAEDTKLLPSDQDIGFDDEGGEVLNCSASEGNDKTPRQRSKRRVQTQLETGSRSDRNALTPRKDMRATTAQLRSFCVEEEPRSACGSRTAASSSTAPPTGVINANPVAKQRHKVRSVADRTTTTLSKVGITTSIVCDSQLGSAAPSADGLLTPREDVSEDREDFSSHAGHTLRERVEKMERRLARLLETGRSAPSTPRRSAGEDEELRAQLLQLVEPKLMQRIGRFLAERLPDLVEEITQQEVRKIAGDSYRPSNTRGTCVSQKSSVWFGARSSFGSAPESDVDSLEVEEPTSGLNRDNVAQLIESTLLANSKEMTMSAESRPLTTSQSNVRMFFDRMSAGSDGEDHQSKAGVREDSSTANSQSAESPAKISQREGKKKRVVVVDNPKDMTEDVKAIPGQEIAATLPAAVARTEGQSTACTLQIIQVTDVYTLENFPSLRTLIMEKRAELEKRRGSSGSKTVSVLTGDFLMPYLLSSIDAGRGMMTMINETPIDYLTWGNHEADLAHADVLARESEYKGIWINSNMTDHESYPQSTCQTQKAIVEIQSADGSNRRKVGMIGVLSDEPNLYKAGAFGGAIIEDPWEVLRELTDELEGNDGVDLVLPLCHLYENQDERTAQEFDYPVILGGHDHHKVDRMINGTRLLKPGMDGIWATILTLTWDDASTKKPEVHAEFVEVKNWEPDPRLLKLSQDCYSVLDRLRMTSLALVPTKFYPFSSVGTRSGPSTTAMYLCTTVRDALNLDCYQGTSDCDCVFINGGNIRGNLEYPLTNGRCVVTLETLRSELDQNVAIFVVTVPGHVIKDALRDTWQASSGAWMHYDDQVTVDDQGLVVNIGNQPLDPYKNYLIGTTTRFGVRLVPKIAAYLDENNGWPDPDSGSPVHALLMSLFAEVAWTRVWHFLDPEGRGEIDPGKLKMVDQNGDGHLNKEELLSALTNIGLSTHEGEYAFVDILLSVTGDQDGVSVEKLTARRQDRLHKLKPLKDSAHRSTRLEFLLHERKTLSSARFKAPRA